jgi:glycine cleavage system H protein
MEFPNEYRYTKEHEWVSVLGDGSVVVGITDFAQSELGDLVFVALPKTGLALKPGDTLCVVDSTKAASDVYAPLEGVVQEVNQSLVADPGLINRAPYTEGWIAKLGGVEKGQVDALMSAEEYKKFLGK